MDRFLDAHLVYSSVRDVSTYHSNVSFGDKIRRFFSSRATPELKELEGFVAQRKGVEGYIEPLTATSPTTLLLVDRDGDYVRATIREPEDATRFCNAVGIPVYDASVIGYPKRMKEFERRRGNVPRMDVDAEIEEIERRLSEEQ